MSDEVQFKEFGKILHIGKLYMSITQKLHGTNAQILIYEDESGNKCVKAGSRNRWLSIFDDNFGFAKFVNDNAEEFIAKLGVGRHFGEWCGPGINSGEGLQEKTLCLFNWRRWIGKELPNRVTTVPMLYKGAISINAIGETMDKLKEQGSYLVPGYMKPEGIVIELDGQFYKNVFDDEEVSWKQKERPLFESKDQVDISYLLQPLRLEKILSKDEKYVREYPKSLGSICSAYFADLEEEKQFKSTNDDDLKGEKKALGRSLFYFVKSIVGSRALT